MRITRITAVLLTLAILWSCSSVEKEGALSYSPAQPTDDGILSVEYHPDLSASPIADPALVKLRFTLLGAGGERYSEALPMEKHGKAWRCGPFSTIRACGLCRPCRFGPALAPG